MTPLSKVCGDIAYYVGGGNTSKGNRERVERIVKEAGRIIGVSQSKEDITHFYGQYLVSAKVVRKVCVHFGYVCC